MTTTEKLRELGFTQKQINRWRKSLNRCHVKFTDIIDVFIRDNIVCFHYVVNDWDEIIGFGF